VIALEAKYKLAEARYFLDQLKDLKNKPDEFMHNLSAFLSAWRSVLDVLLYDYAEKYFGWSREDKLNQRDFEVAAKASGIRDARNFIQWYKKQIQLLSGNPLAKKRVVIVHRGRPKVTKTYRLYLVETIAMQESIALELLKQKLPGAAIIAEPSFGDESKRPDFVARLTDVFFEDYKSKEIGKVCEEAYELVKEIVEEAEKTFK